MTAPVLQFRVAAVPKPQGSKRGFVVRSKATGKHRAVVVDSDKGPLRDFREAVRCDAVEAAGEGWTPLQGPLRVVLLFALRAPKSLPKTSRRWPIGRTAGDVDKLTRAVFDALTDAAVWDDDGQVVDARIVKDYPTPDVAQSTPGVLVRIWRAEGSPPPSTGQIPLLAEQDTTA